MKPIRIGPYELLESLGEGGMGHVYRARDTRLGRVVAIKFLQAQSVADQRRQLRFLREAKAEAALNHPNLATLLDVGEVEVDDPALAPPREPGEAPARVPYLVLEFVPGQDLRELTRGGPLPVGELLRIARQIASGLRAAHVAGVVHRDLKPSNIRVTPDGLVKILDFGLARFVDGAAPTSDELKELATSEGVVVGTVPYLAPEQAAGMAIDARADLFSLGVLLYELACGRLPFVGVSTVDRLRSVLHDDPPPLAECAPDLPPRFAELVHHLLAKDPSRRPHDAAEVERVLEKLSHGEADADTYLSLPSATGSVASGSRPSLEVALGGRHSTRRRVTLSLLAGLALVFAALYFVDRRRLAEAESLIAQGREFEGRSDPQAARIAAGLYERATQLRPRMALAWAVLSEALAEAYRVERLPELLERATAAAQRATELDPRASEACIAQARIERMHGDARRAIEMLADLPQAAPHRDRIERELAASWAAAGEPARAEDHLLKAVARAPKSWINWNALGAFRVRSANYPGARTAFEEAAKLAPERVTSPRENLASVLVLEGKYAEALAAYESIRGPLADADTASNLGAIYYMNGRHADAEHLFRQAIRIAPRDPRHHRNLADVLLHTGRGEEAKREYAEALSLADTLLSKNPGDDSLRLQRTLYLARAGRCDEAMRAAMEIEQERAPTALELHRLARPFALCGDAEGAIGRLRRAVALGEPPAPLADEDELAPLRREPGFRQLVESRAEPARSGG